MAVGGNIAEQVVDVPMPRTLVPTTKINSKYDISQDHDGTLTKNPLLRFWALVVFAVLIVSWTATMVAYSLPYWRFDSHNTAGFWNVCGTANVGYNYMIKDLYFYETVPYRCMPLYAFRQQILDQMDALPSSVREQDETFKRLRFEVVVGIQDIYIGAGLELARLIASITFGIGAILTVLYPVPNSSRADMRGMICLLGIYATPLLILVNCFATLTFWEYFGIGRFDKLSMNFLGVSGQIMIGTGFVDLIVQYSFFRWGTRKNGWRARGKQVKVIAIGI